jgi:creatinine amidohydrolase
MLWNRLTSEQIKQCAEQNYVVIVPFGATEQHGKHLPVDTDANIAYEITKRIGETVENVLIAPVVNIGFSPHHLGFSGTISYSFNTFAAVIHDICKSIASNGFKKIIMLNTHGGNVAFLQARALGLMEELEIGIGVITYWHFVKEELNQLRESESGGMFHACELETSVQLYLRPELVKLDKAVKQLNNPPLSYLGKDMTEGSKGYIALPYRGTGVKGDPTLATVEKGERAMHHIVEKVGFAIKEFRDADFQTDRLWRGENT